MQSMKTCRLPGAQQPGATRSIHQEVKTNLAPASQHSFVHGSDWSSQLGILVAFILIDRGKCFATSRGRAVVCGPPRTGAWVCGIAVGEDDVNNACLVENADTAGCSMLKEELVELRADDVPCSVVGAESDKVGVCKRRE